MIGLLKSLDRAEFWTIWSIEFFSYVFWFGLNISTLNGFLGHNLRSSQTL